MTIWKNLVIVGSGPVGMVAALVLKDRFERVILLERQSEDQFLQTRGFTFPIVFSPAAIAVLKRIGVWDAISSERSPYFGVVIHMRLLGREFRRTARRSGVYSHWRNHIITSLYDRVRSEGIEVVFGAEVDGIDFASSVCNEASLGPLDYDLLLGADGIQSFTRRSMAQAHPDVQEEEFQSLLMDRWHAYRLPSTGELGERFGGGDGYSAAHVFVDNRPAYPDDKVRLITVAMTRPREEVSVVVKYGPEVSDERVKEINDSVFAELVGEELLDREWDQGVSGEYRHVDIPAFHLGSALLIGDAAHGFEGNGDLINLGIGSVGALAEQLERDQQIPTALANFDRTVGEALREYSSYALRRSREKIDWEVAAFEAGALLRLNGHHPSLWGIYEDDFEIETYMEGYKQLRRRFRNLGYLGVAVALLAACCTLTKRRSPR